LSISLFFILGIWFESTALLTIPLWPLSGFLHAIGYSLIITALFPLPAALAVLSSPLMLTLLLAILPYLLLVIPAGLSPLLAFVSSLVVIWMGSMFLHPFTFPFFSIYTLIATNTFLMAAVLLDMLSPW
jgi:hypothetical protein